MKRVFLGAHRILRMERTTAPLAKLSPAPAARGWRGPSSSKSSRLANQWMEGGQGLLGAAGIAKQGMEGSQVLPGAPGIAY